VSVLRQVETQIVAEFPSFARGTAVAEVAVMPMPSRRFVLSCCVLAMASTAVSHVHASTTDLEGAAYGGTTAGGWACGPAGRVNYGGVGARVRVSERPARYGGSGVVGEVAAGGAYEATSFVRCGTQCGSAERIMPPPGPVLGANARAGYHGSWWGVEGGVGFFQDYSHHLDDHPTTHTLPIVEVSLGDHELGRAVVGIGSPTVTTLSRPGVYVGGDFGVSGIDWEMRLGAERAGPGPDVGVRGDVAALVPLTPALRLRLGASASSVSEAGAGAEGSAGLRGTL
jgi:hypothetical protein